MKTLAALIAGILLVVGSLVGLAGTALLVLDGSTGLLVLAGGLLITAVPFLRHGEVTTGGVLKARR